MNSLGGQAAESFPTNWTEARFFTRVSPEMVGKSLLEFKLNSALVAHIFNLVGLFVSVEVLLALEFLFTSHAFVLLNF